jgi:NADPH:quinone reductase-like Zn-dependent oxidoreductase
VWSAGTLEKSLKAAALEGQISLVGWLAKDISTIDIAAISATVVRMHRIALGSRAQFIAMNRAIGLHRLKPFIDRVFPFSDAVDAFRYYEAGRSFGKVVITLDWAGTSRPAGLAHDVSWSGCWIEWP